MWPFSPPKNKEASSLSAFFTDELAAGFSGRLCGNMSLNYGDTRESLVNRKNFLESLGVDPRSLVCAKQTHGLNIKRAGYLQRGNGALSREAALADTDALITNEKNLPLAMFTADCLSVFLYDPLTRSIGLAHAGWRGTEGKIVSKTIDVMHSEFNARPDNIRGFFGPAIRSCCYQVGNDLQGKFSQGLSRRSRKLFLDLALVNRQQMVSCGVKPENINDCLICTCCRNREYFSFRKEGSACGRIMSVLMLK